MMPVAPASVDPSTRPLSEVARHVVQPDGIVDTLWYEVEDQCAEWGDEFDAWQDGLGQLALGLREDGYFASTIGGVTLSIPRQVAKTFIVSRIIFAICILYPNITVLWTAHRTRTSTQTFDKLKGLTRNPVVKSHLARDRSEGVRSANGEQEIRFKNGSVIMFGAREQGFGRGFDEVDIEVFDEAQILTEKALEDMVAATNQSRFPHGALLFYMGTPPRPTDPGEPFSLKRSKALSGDSKDMLYIECSADEDADPDDHEQWARANPSYPNRTPLESMLRLRENLPSDDAWKREALGIWDSVTSKGVIPGPTWAEQGKGHSLAVDRFALGVECGPDLAWASVAFAGERADKDWHLELDEDQHTKGRGTAWLVPHIEYLLANNSQIRAVVADVGGPVAAMLEQRANYRWYFKGSSIEVTPVKVSELGVGCAQVLNGIVSGWLHHIDQPQLNAAALTAGKRPLGDTGMWVWSRKMAESDITPIQAGTLALIGAQNAIVRTPARKSGGRRVVTG
jgi:hypothetical protein